MVRGLMLTVGFLMRRTSRNCRPDPLSKGTGPLSAAFEAVRAMIVPQNGFKTHDGRGETACPLVGPHFEVWNLPARRIIAHPYNFREIGIRLSLQASGATTNFLKSVAGTPPALRKTSLRELRVSPQAQGQIGYPPTMGTHASQGYPCMARRSEVIAMPRCDVGKHMPARSGRPVRKAHSAPKIDLAQRSKVG